MNVHFYVIEICMTYWISIERENKNKKYSSFQTGLQISSMLTFKTHKLICICILEYCDIYTDYCNLHDYI